MKEIVLDISGMTCQGCMNTIKLHIDKIIGYGDIDMELIPGHARILCEDDVDYTKIIDEINQETNYHASFKEENEIEEFEE